MGFTPEVPDFEEYFKFLIEVNLEDVSWMHRNQFVEQSCLLTTKNLSALTEALIGWALEYS